MLGAALLSSAILYRAYVKHVPSKSSSDLIEVDMLRDPQMDYTIEKRETLTRTFAYKIKNKTNEKFGPPRFFGITYSNKMWSSGVPETGIEILPNNEYKGRLNLQFVGDDAYLKSISRGDCVKEKATLFLFEIENKTSNDPNVKALASREIPLNVCRH